MARRLELHALLETITDNVYFDPPNNFRMQYPCIRYKREANTTVHADDIPYNVRWGYQIMVIDPDPDSDIVELVAALPLCSFSSDYVAENLHHDVFVLYF